MENKQQLIKMFASERRIFCDGFEFNDDNLVDVILYTEEMTESIETQITMKQFDDICNQNGKDLWKKKLTPDDFISNHATRFEREGISKAAIKLIESLITD